MKHQRVPKKNLPKIELGTLLVRGEGQHLFEKEIREIAEAVTYVPHEKLPRGVKRVRIYGVTTGSSRYNEDQRFTASCSYNDEGMCEAPFVLLICHNDVRGWYIVVKSVR